MYDELIKRLRRAASYDPRTVVQDCEDAADVIEELQQYADLYKDLTEKSQKVATELKQQLQKSEEDNVNLTGWLAEEHAKHLWIPVERLPDSCGHYFVFIIGGEIGQISWETTAFFDGKIFRWEHMGQEHPEDVTHWMPLPEPPKEET